MSWRLTPDTRPDVQIDFDDDGNITRVREGGVLRALARGQEVLTENQEKNIALRRLVEAGILAEEEKNWSRKNGQITIAVPNNKRRDAESLVSDLGVTING